MQLETHSVAETVQYMTDIQSDFLKYMIFSCFQSKFNIDFVLLNFTRFLVK